MQYQWDERYSSDEFVYGREPNDFLADHYHRIPKGGKVLCLAEGEGRNAVFLARQGYEVVAVDLSAVGLKKAERFASEQGVTITTVVADLAAFTVKGESFDGIISIFCHTPPPIRERLHKEVVAALKPYGVLILEGYRPDQVGRGTGGPPVKELTMELPVLQKEFSELNLIHAKELEREIHEGCLHNGKGAVVQIIGIKP